MTTRPDMDAIEAHLAASTPGEWTLNPYGDDGELGAGDVYADGGPLIGHDVMGNDAAFIIAAHTEMPAVIAYVRTLEALVQAFALSTSHWSAFDGYTCGACGDGSEESLDAIPHAPDCPVLTYRALGLDKDAP